MSNHLLLDLGICATFHLIYRRTECKNRTKSCLVLPKISLIFLNIFGQLAFPFEIGRGLIGKQARCIAKDPLTLLRVESQSQS